MFVGACIRVGRCMRCVRVRVYVCMCVCVGELTVRARVSVPVGILQGVRVLSDFGLAGQAAPAAPYDEAAALLLTDLKTTLTLQSGTRGSPPPS